MSDQNLNPNAPVQSSNNIWKIITAILITAIVVGGGVYAWQKSNMRIVEQSLQQQITDMQNQITDLQKPTQPIAAIPETTETPIETPIETPMQIIDNTPSPLSQSNEVAKIIQKISEHCKEYNIPGCLPVTSYSVVDLDDKYSVVKIGEFNYLLTKKNSEWGVSIASQEKNICDTGSGSTDLFEYCNR